MAYRCQFKTLDGIYSEEILVLEELPSAVPHERCWIEPFDIRTFDVSKPLSVHYRKYRYNGNVRSGFYVLEEQP